MESVPYKTAKTGFVGIDVPVDPRNDAEVVPYGRYRNGVEPVPYGKYRNDMEVVPCGEKKG